MLKMHLKNNREGVGGREKKKQKEKEMDNLDTGN